MELSAILRGFEEINDEERLILGKIEVEQHKVRVMMEAMTSEPTLIVELFNAALDRKITHIDLIFTYHSIKEQIHWINLKSGTPTLVFNK